MVHEFDNYRLDIARRELWCGSQERAVEPQVFSLLVYLIENRARVVSKDELIDVIWEGRIVSDATLSTRINGARKALGDTGKEQAVIRTIPRRGFRFIAELANPGEPLAATSEHELKQTVRFCTAHDGVQIAYATSGEGPPIVKAPNWMHHLEHDWESPIWGHLLRALSQDHTLVRFDQRGNGLSDRNISEFLFDDMIGDLHTVVGELGLEKFPLLGVSQGCAYSIAYAALYPERVSHLVLYGGYVRGLNTIGSEAALRKAELNIQMIRDGWGKNNPAFRQFFTTLFMPDATKEQMDWFNELQRTTISPDDAARTEKMLANIDVSDLAARISVPTLVLHCRDDAVVRFKFGREMATLIPNAKFVALDGQNHLFLEDEPAMFRFMDEVRSFLADE